MRFCPVVPHATPISNADCSYHHTNGAATTLPDRGEHHVWTIGNGIAWRPWLRSLLHLGEMVLAMMVGMCLLALPSGAVVSALGYSNSDPAVSALVMTFNMTVPMVVWMLVRGDTRERAGEMGAAMVIPVIVIVVMSLVGVHPCSGLSGTVMDPIIPAMIAVMLFRRSECAHGGSHRSEPAFGEELEFAG